MKLSSTIFLQGVVALIGIVTLVIMIRFPLTEGRAASLDLLAFTLIRLSCMSMPHLFHFLLHCTRHSNYSDISDKIPHS